MSRSHYAGGAPGHREPPPHPPVRKTTSPATGDRSVATARVVTRSRFAVAHAPPPPPPRTLCARRGVGRHAPPRQRRVLCPLTVPSAGLRARLSAPAAPCVINAPGARGVPFGPSATHHRAARVAAPASVRRALVPLPRARDGGPADARCAAVVSRRCRARVSAPRRVPRVCARSRVRSTCLLARSARLRARSARLRACSARLHARSARLRARCAPSPFNGKMRAAPTPRKWTRGRRLSRRRCAPRSPAAHPRWPSGRPRPRPTPTCRAP
eukprot:731366-Pleurochrysis_carterae.AAC.1